MPTHLVGPMEGVVDKQRATAGSAAVPGGSMTTPANYVGHTELDAALTAANGAYYTAARLNIMNLNDKIYALRTLQDSDQFP